MKGTRLNKASLTINAVRDGGTNGAEGQGQFASKGGHRSGNCIQYISIYCNKQSMGR
jgi:hypothetical protein